MFASDALDTMRFAEFVDSTQKIVHYKPNVTLLCETRVDRAFKASRPKISRPFHLELIDNRELAETWCRARSLPLKFARQTLFCDGVRQALELLLTSFARDERRVAVPSDVYPEYLNIVRRVGVNTIAFETFPDFDIGSVLSYSSGEGADIIILPEPLVLQGRNWTESEVERAIVWLRADSERRLCIDGVYSFGLPLDSPVRTLLNTDQVIYLDSSSKGWASTFSLGFGCFPQRDFAVVTDIFERLQLSQEKLFLGHELLSRFAWLPLQIMGEIDRRRLELLANLRQLGLQTLSPVRGYFVAIEMAASTLLDRHDLLAMPASVFGCNLPQWSIASALPAVPAMMRA